MRNISCFVWILLLMRGVSGADENTINLTLLVGDSITLNTGLNEIVKEDTMRWFFGEGQEEVRVAEFRENATRINEKFKHTLKVDGRNRSLTIANITSEHDGVYKLKNTKEDIIILFIVSGKVGVKNVPVMEGDSVTLHTGFTQIDGLKWTSECGNLNPSSQTGDLTITNVERHQCGKYVLEINNSRMSLQRTYNVVLKGTVKNEIVKEGKDVTLQTGLIEIQNFDLILWETGGVLVAEFNKRTNRVLYNKENGRLHLDRQSGDLIIRDSRTNDSGDYDLQMSCRTYSLRRTVSLTVNSPDSSVSPGAAAGIVVGLLMFHWCLQL